MKIQSTPDQARAIAEMLKPRTFDCQSCDPKYNAQRNLQGRTHYVEDDTLRWHKSCILGSGEIPDTAGLLFRITESCALDSQNRSRGFRCVVFDVFGTTIYHPALDKTFSTSKAAEKACNAEPFDLVAHYRDVMQSRLQLAENEAAALLAITHKLHAMETAPMQLAIA